MLSKPQFEQFLNLIKNYGETEEKFSKGLEVLIGTQDNYICCVEPFMKVKDELVEMLMVLMDEDMDTDTSWVSYWVYDCDFGAYPTTIQIEDCEPQTTTVDIIYDLMQNK